MKRGWLWLPALLVGVVALVWLAWGPLLITSPEEALAQVQNHQSILLDETYGRWVQAYERTTGHRGQWQVRRNQSYDWWGEGDRGGYLWIVVYSVPGTEGTPRFEVLVKNLTGGIKEGG
jgi:hypothetical protein